MGCQGVLWPRDNGVNNNRTVDSLYLGVALRTARGPGAPARFVESWVAGWAVLFWWYCRIQYMYVATFKVMARLGSFYMYFATTLQVCYM